MLEVDPEFVTSMAKIVKVAPAQASLDMLKSLMKDGRISLDSLDADGYPLWDAWFKTLDVYAQLDVQTLEALKSLDILWLQSYSKKNSLLVSALQSFLWDKKDEQVMMWFLRNSPKECLSLMVKDVGVNSLLNRATQRGALDVVEYVLRHEDLDYDSLPGLTVRNIIKNVGLWKLFLSKGGNPLRLIDIDTGELRTLAVWDAVLENYRSEDGGALGVAIKNWVELNFKESLEVITEKRYWTNLRYGAGANLKRSPGWMNKRNELGQTPMMVVVESNVSSMKTFMNVQQARDGVKAIDNQGRNLWYYVMRHGNSASKYREWLHKSVPMKITDAGWGLFSQIVDGDEGEGLSVELFDKHEALMERNLWNQEPELFWGDERGQYHLLQWLARHVEPFKIDKKLFEGLTREIINTPVDFFKRMNPELLGFLAIIVVETTHNSWAFIQQTAQNDCVSALLESGALFYKCGEPNWKAFLSSNKRYTTVRIGFEKNTLFKKAYENFGEKECFAPRLKKRI